MKPSQLHSARSIRTASTFLGPCYYARQCGSRRTSKLWHESPIYVCMKPAVTKLCCVTLTGSYLVMLNAHICRSVPARRTTLSMAHRAIPENQIDEQFCKNKGNIGNQHCCRAEPTSANWATKQTRFQRDSEVWQLWNT